MPCKVEQGHTALVVTVRRAGYAAAAQQLSLSRCLCLSLSIPPSQGHGPVVTSTYQWFVFTFVGTTRKSIDPRVHHFLCPSSVGKVISPPLGICFHFLAPAPSSDRFPPLLPTLHSPPLSLTPPCFPSLSFSLLHLKKPTCSDRASGSLPAQLRPHAAIRREPASWRRRFGGAKARRHAKVTAPRGKSVRR